MVSRWAHNPKVGGSSPSPATKKPILIAESPCKNGNRRAWCAGCRCPDERIRRLASLEMSYLSKCTIIQVAVSQNETRCSVLAHESRKSWLAMWFDFTHMPWVVSWHSEQTRMKPDHCIITGIRMLTNGKTCRKLRWARERRRCTHPKWWFNSTALTKVPKLNSSVNRLPTNVGRHKHHWVRAFFILTF